MIERNGYFLKGFIRGKTVCAALFTWILVLFFDPAAVAGDDFASPSIGGGCDLCGLDFRVSSARLESVIRGISGEDSVTVNGERVLIPSRYAFSPEKLLALEYLRQQAGGMGYQTEVQSFPLTVIRPDLLSLAVSKSGDTAWVGAADGRIFRTVRRNGDLLPFSGLSEIEGAEVFCLYYGPEGGLWAGCGLSDSPRGAVYLSRDGGMSWEKKSEDSSGLNTVLCVSFADSRFGMAAGQMGSLLITVNGGESWSLRENAPAAFGFRDLNDCGLSGGTYWIAADRGGLYRSEDYGITWEETILGTFNLNGISFSDSLHGVIAAEGNLLYTLDGGGSWNAVSAQPDFLDVEMADSLMAAACGGSGDIYLSRDGGRTWTALPPECAGTGKRDAIDFAGDSLVLVTGEEKVVKVRFSGETLEDCRTQVVADTIIGKNLSFRRDGSSGQRRRVVLCAHYDSYNWKDPYGPAPGADDNGTGTAAVMECARALADANLEHTVEFILFDGEEVGLLGSRYYIDNIDTTYSYGPVFNLDMFGRDYSGDGWAVEIAGRPGTDDSLLYTKLLESAEFLGLDIKPSWQPSSPTSDHKSFWEMEGVSAILVIEGDFSDNPTYHSAGDRVNNIDFEYYTQCVRMTLVALAGEAGYSGGLPDELLFVGGYPNPFSSKTSIRFELPKRLYTTLDVYDVTGRKVAGLIDGYAGPGKIGYVWDGRDDRGGKLASGVYFIRFIAGGRRTGGKLVLIR